MASYDTQKSTTEGKAKTLARRMNRAVKYKGATMVTRSARAKGRVA